MNTWIKMGVMGDLTPECQKGLGRAIKLYHGNKLDFFLTSIRESNHMPGSFHYIGRAFDFKRQKISVAVLRAALGLDFQVIENKKLDIFHVEQDK